MSLTPTDARLARAESLLAVRAARERGDDKTAKAYRRRVVWLEAWLAAHPEADEAVIVEAKS